MTAAYLCPGCSGKGHVPRPDPERLDYTVNVPCDRCGGTGRYSPQPHAEALADPDRCGATQIVNGKEWVCIRKVHDREYRRHHTDANHPNPEAHGTGAHPERMQSQAPPADRHYFVRRWPGTDR